MKRWLALLLTILPVFVYADVVTLTALWEPPSTYSDVREYSLWLAPTPTGLFVVETEFTGGSTDQGAFTINMNPGETIYAELTAVYQDGEESGPSNVASYTHPFVTPPPDPPPPVVKEAPRNLVLRPAS